VPSKLQNLRRLQEITWREVQTRARQELNKRLDTMLHRAGVFAHVNGAKHKQDSPARFFFAQSDVTRRTELLRSILPEQVENILHDADNICAHRFRLLGYESVEYGRDIDWHLDAVHGKRAPLSPWHKVPFLEFSVVGDHKITWELNRHQHLVTLAKAWVLSGNPQYVDELIGQWYSWQSANPFAKGINWSSSLEVSLRSLSWLWVYFLLSDCPAIPPRFERDLLQALALNGSFIERYLSTYFSPNTHLLGEALGLFFIGTLFPQILTAEDWRQEGWKILLREAKRQVRTDGTYFERSLYYHVYALDFFIHARLLAARNTIDIPTGFDSTILNMLEVLRTLSQAGPPLGFGDDDGGRLFDSRRNQREHLMDPLALGATLYRLPELSSVASLTEEAVWLFGEQAVTMFGERASSPQTKSMAFEDSGIYVIASNHSPSQQFVVNAGDMGGGTAGHAHADALAVTMSVDGHELLVDSGTYCYIGPENDRNLFRGTRAHNTVVVDGHDQAVPNGPFSWRSSPQISVESRVSGDTFSYIRAGQNGFCRLPDPVFHRRSIFHLHGGFWLVCDRLDGRQRHIIEILWHFGSNVTLIREGDRFIACQRQVERRVVVIPTLETGMCAHLEWAEISPAYGKKQQAPLLRIAGQVQLPTERATLIATLDDSSDHARKFTRIDHTETTICAYRYQQSACEHVLLFSTGANWSFGPLVSDAKLVYLGTEHGRALHFIICGGSFVDLDGKRILNSPNTFERFEWVCAPNETSGRVSASENAAIHTFSEDVLRTLDLTSLSN